MNTHTTPGHAAPPSAQSTAFERSAVHACASLVDAASAMSGSDADALAWFAREANRHFTDLSERAKGEGYGLVVAIATGGIAWCEDRADDPRLPRAVRAHARAIAMVVQARMRGDRRNDADELMAGLAHQLHELLRPL